MGVLPVEPGIARERETRADDPPPCQSACRTLPAPDAATAPRGRTLERRSPTGIARERETRAHHECRTTSFITGGVNGRTRSWGFSRWSPASRGSAKPAPMTLAATPKCVPHPPRPDAATAPRGHTLERRSPTGIARERETRAHHECRTTSFITGGLTGGPDHGGSPGGARHRAGARNRADDAGLCQHECRTFPTPDSAAAPRSPSARSAIARVRNTDLCHTCAWQ